jgi:hypothetical protein
MAFSSSPGNGASPEKLRADPIDFKGVHYHSKKEARFAEYLTQQLIPFKPHPSNWPGSYKPDFYLWQFKLFVEVKPKEFLWELGIYSEEIENEGPEPTPRWICVDQLSREWHGWHLLRCNSEFAGSHPVSVIERDNPKIKFYRDEDNCPRLELGCPFIYWGWTFPWVP